MVGVFQNLSKITIKSSFGDYEIKFQPLKLINFENFYILMDQTLQGRFNLNDDRCVYVTADEASKTLGSVEDIMVQLSAKGMTKNCELIVIGGGFLQDLGTLVASLYMRGVKWIYMPTTLAAMGDSCIGGKSSINAGSVKNLVGNFYPPSKIFIDPAFASTLPDLEVIAGFSEILKICFARSFETFTECSNLISDWNENSNQAILSDVIHLSLKSKQYFVEEDEFDHGVRKLLNFGHSFGHALESASNYRIPHGVAVLIGMLAASLHTFSEPSPQATALIKASLALIRKVGEEVVLDILRVDFEKFSKALAKDKKNTKSDLVLVLPKANALEIVNIPFNQDALQGATNAMKSGIEMVLDEIR